MDRYFSISIRNFGKKIGAIDYFLLEFLDLVSVPKILSIIFKKGHLPSQIGLVP
jgi:hypothetical protein